MSNLGWNNSRASYVVLEGDAPNQTPQLGFNSSATIFLAGGGEADFPFGQDYGQNYDPETRILLLDQYQPASTLLAARIEGHPACVRYMLMAPRISTGLPSSHITVISGDIRKNQQFLLSRHIDANGDTTWFDYVQTFVGGIFGSYLLTTVIDPDGLTNTA